MAHPLTLVAAATLQPMAVVVDLRNPEVQVAEVADPDKTPVAVVKAE